MQLIEEGVSLMIETSRATAVEETDIKTELKAEEIAIWIAIEFCIRIKCIDFLFSTLLNKFTEYKLEEAFFKNLETFIIGGSFKDMILSNYILRKIVSISFWLNSLNNNNDL